MARIPGVPEARLDLLPYAAAVLERLIARIGVQKSLVFPFTGCAKDISSAFCPMT
ncbi:MAG: hypothetical protein U1E97_04300 [Alphaproteobacteria bacterium]